NGRPHPKVPTALIRSAGNGATSPSLTSFDRGRPHRNQARQDVMTAAEEMLKPNTASIDQLCIDTIRTLSMDAVQKAESGHPGTPMALAPVLSTLWQRVLRYDPTDPLWLNRDRFVLSNGHASMLLYSILHLAG